MSTFTRGKQYLMAIALISMSGPAAAEDATFEKVCHTCHTGGFKGFVSGAPNVNNASDWNDYLQRHTLEQMQEIVLNGSDDHKVKGGCRTCSDKEVVSAIDHMLLRIKQTR